MRGLCFSGGGIKAAAHIGALKALEEKNIKFDCVSGASSGSIVTTLYALGYSSEQMWTLFQKYYKKIKYAELKQILKLILGLLSQRELIIDGLNSGKSIEKIMNDICQKSHIKNINQIKMPLFISMVDLQTGTVDIATSSKKRAKLSDDVQYVTDIPIATAVRASCSFPVVFSPCKFKGIQLIDGGTRENLPWKCLKDIGTDDVIGICFDTIHQKECCKNIVEVATRAMELQGRELSTYEKNGIDKLITINLEKTSLLGSDDIYKLYIEGYKQTLKYI